MELKTVRTQAVDMVSGKLKADAMNPAISITSLRLPGGRACASLHGSPAVLEISV